MKKEENPDFAHQYGKDMVYLETTYKNDFIKKSNPVCPAKIFIESKGEGMFSSTKSHFNENSDFKAMSPNFQAISTAKNFNFWTMISIQDLIIIIDFYNANYNTVR